MQIDRYKTWIVAAVAIFLIACVADENRRPIEKDGRLYGVTEGAFNDRWWNFYERALSYADGRFYDEAVKDMAEAVKLRSVDQRRARTYGMHFIDYFPHRELGVLYYHQGKYTQAEQELLQSLGMTASSKAQLYLNRTRQKQVLRNQTDVDHPKINLPSATGAVLTNQAVLQIAGSATDDTYVAMVDVEKVSIDIPVVRSVVDFQADIALKTGHNTIPIRVQDISGKTMLTHIEAIYDPTGPLVQVDRVTARPAGNNLTELEISGLVTDDNGVSLIKLGERFIDGKGKTQIPFQISAPGISIGEIDLMAKDMAGNETHAVVEAAGRRQSPSPQQAPKITIRDQEDWRMTFLDRIFLEGSVEAVHPLQKLLINDQRISDCGGRKLYFSRIVPLQPGANTLTLSAVDNAGNCGRRSLAVTRQKLAVRQLGSRLRVAVNNFERSCIGANRKLSFGMEDLVTDALMDRGRFNVLDRRQLVAVLNELKLNQSGLVDDDDAITVGQLLAADCIMLGAVLERRDSVEAYIRLVDIETAEIIAAVDVYGEDMDIGELRKLSQGVDLKFTSQLPVVEGLVIQRDGARITIDLGEKQHLRKGMKLIVYRMGDLVHHPVSKQAIGIDFEVLGHARIETVMDDMSYALLSENTLATEIDPMINIITR